MTYLDLSGIWSVALPDASAQKVILPGTLDTNNIGEKEKENIATRLTRKHTYEGEAVFFRKVIISDFSENERLFFEVERARCLRLKVNGKEVSPFTQGTLSTPYIFEITDFIQAENIFEVISDNSYPGLPHNAITHSSAATDETQTNWNGLLGFIRVRREPVCFISSFLIRPKGNEAQIDITISSSVDYAGEIVITSHAFTDTLHFPFQIKKNTEMTLSEKVTICETALFWDEYDGNLYSVSASIGTDYTSKVQFGIRDFGINKDYRLTLNNRPIFIRSEANCCEFPETGHMPLTVSEWKKVLETFKSYGVNFMRFHSHCPPDAAFTAADQMGILMQPELSHWNPFTAFEDDESYSYYAYEIKQILATYGNHPSFVMLTYGNELSAGELGHQRMGELLDMAKELDQTKLYANSSNAHLGYIGPDQKSDVCTAQIAKDWLPLRGIFGGGKAGDIHGPINEEYPSTLLNYDEGVAYIHEHFGQPVFGFEVGQFEVLPEFTEIDDFKGITIPRNYEMIRENAQEKGFLPQWEEFVEATGELALIGYREEIEAVLRTEGMSGLSLLGLQDFPGQGTALVGMLNAHLQPKPYDFARPEKFQRFFTSILPLLLMSKYTYYKNEILEAEIKLAHYGKEPISDSFFWKITDSASKEIMSCGNFESAAYQPGKLHCIGKICTDLSFCEKATRYDIQLKIGAYENSYPVWIYPEKKIVAPQNILVAPHLDDAAVTALEMGKIVFLSPEATLEALPKSISGQFTTDFWSVGSFPSQTGSMGCLINTDHPAIKNFPSEKHTNWQWWAMTKKGRPMILPQKIKPIITVMDCYSRLKHMGLLFEAKVSNGKILFSSMGLLENQDKPEVSALINNLFVYMSSEEFQPETILELKDVQELLS